MFRQCFGEDCLSPTKTCNRAFVRRFRHEFCARASPPTQCDEQLIQTCPGSQDINPSLNRRFNHFRTRSKPFCLPKRLNSFQPRLLSLTQRSIADRETGPFLPRRGHTAAVYKIVRVKYGLLRYFIRYPTMIKKNSYFSKYI